MQMQTGFKIYWGALMSGGLYLTLPTFLIAFLAQRYRHDPRGGRRISRGVAP